MLKLTNISVTFKQTSALDAINLQIQKNKTTVLIGPSGCGKSTLLRLVAGLVSPDSGSILFDGTPLGVDNITSLRHKMGYVIQEGGLFPHLTVRDNVILMARYLGWPLPKIDKRLLELAELVQLDVDKMARHPAQLSGGQRQRVSLMRALMLKPEVLLLDEPLAALDPMIRFDLQQELKLIFERLSITVVLVTHDIAEAAFFADHVVLMREGHIVQEGSLRTLANHPKESFVGDFITAQRKPLENLNKAMR